MKKYLALVLIPCLFLVLGGCTSENEFTLREQAVRCVFDSCSKVFVNVVYLNKEIPNYISKVFYHTGILEKNLVIPCNKEGICSSVTEADNITKQEIFKICKYGSCENFKKDREENFKHSDKGYKE